MKTITASIELSQENIDAIAVYFGYTEESGVSKDEFVAEVFKKELTQKFSNIFAQDALKQIDDTSVAQKEATTEQIKTEVSENIEVNIE